MRTGRTSCLPQNRRWQRPFGVPMRRFHGRRRFLENLRRSTGKPGFTARYRFWARCRRGLGACPGRFRTATLGAVQWAGSGALRRRSRRSRASCQISGFAPRSCSAFSRAGISAGQHGRRYFGFERISAGVDAYHGIVAEADAARTHRRGSPEPAGLPSMSSPAPGGSGRGPRRRRRACQGDRARNPRGRRRQPREHRGALGEFSGIHQAVCQGDGDQERQRDDRRQSAAAGGEFPSLQVRRSRRRRDPPACRRCIRR